MQFIICVRKYLYMIRILRSREIEWLYAEVQS